MNKYSVQESFFTGHEQRLPLETPEVVVYPKVEADKGLGRNCLNGGRQAGHRANNCTAERCY